MTQSNGKIQAAEKLRAYMKLTVLDMLNLVGVTRPTYNTWIKGGVVRGSNEEKLTSVIKKLLWVAQQPEWKQYEKSYLTNSKRRDILQKLLSRMEQPNVLD